jgi:hypothetical protein
MKTAAMACMRNEALFVLEWVAYHRAIGFDEILVCTNDCDDGTDRILDRLEALGLVHHIRNDDHGDLAPQPAGVARVLAHPAVQGCRWLLHVDADEFLNIQVGDGTLIDWLPMVDDFDAVAVTWRIFGDMGLTDWPEGALQIETLTRASAVARDFTAMQKTMFDPSAFAAGIDHMPKQPKRDVTLCNAEGGRLDPSAMSHPTLSDHRDVPNRKANRKRHLPWRGACINHYALRSTDLFLLKNHRGDAMRSRFSQRYTLGSRWHRAICASDVEDRLIQRHLAAVRGMIADWRRQDPAIARIEAAAHAWIAATKAGWLTDERVAELTAKAA